MALGASEFTELVTSTMEKIGDQLWDNVHTRHPLLDAIKSEESSATGRQMVVNLELAEDTSTQWTDAAGTFSTAYSNDILGAAVYQWSDPLVSSVRLPWKQLQMNQGSDELVDLVRSHISSMEKAHAKTLTKALHARVWNKNTSSSELQSGQYLSLDQIVSDKNYDADPKGDNSNDLSFQVGGIDSQSQPNWQATRREEPLDESTTIREAFRLMSNDIWEKTLGNNSVNMVVAGRDIFEEFEASFDDKMRYPDPSGTAQARFNELKHGDLTIRFDPDCPPKRAYFLDTNSWYMRSLAGNFMTQQPAQTIEGSLDQVTPIATVMCVGVNERRANGLLLRPDTAGGAA